MWQRLRSSTSGLAATELALSLPFLLVAGMGGVELANYGVTIMRVDQLAIHMADNASRIGDTSMLANRKIYESDIMDLLQGAHIQAAGRSSSSIMAVRLSAGSRLTKTKITTFTGNGAWA